MKWSLCGFNRLWAATVKNTLSSCGTWHDSLITECHKPMQANAELLKTQLSGGASSGEQGGFALRGLMEI